MVRHLRPMVLKILNDKACSGYELVKQIEEKTGWKPSFGSMYPMLEEMRKQELVDSKQTGRKKIYNLTSLGKKRLSTWDERKEPMYQVMKENMKIMGEITGQNVAPMIEVMDRMSKGQDPLAEIISETVEFRNTLMQLALDGKTKKHSEEIKTMLKKMTEKLRSMK